MTFIAGEDDLVSGDVTSAERCHIRSRCLVPWVVMDPATDSRVAEAWRDNRRYVLDVAYRMLGSVSDAEDIVQDAFTRLLNADIEQIGDVRGWLVTVVSRLCIDQLRSARSRREAYVGPWLPEPVIEPADQQFDPAERVTLDDSVRIALLVV